MPRGRCSRAVMPAATRLASRALAIPRRSAAASQCGRRAAGVVGQAREHLVALDGRAAQVDDRLEDGPDERRSARTASTVSRSAPTGRWWSAWRPHRSDRTRRENLDSLRGSAVQRRWTAAPARRAASRRQASRCRCRRRPAAPRRSRPRWRGRGRRRAAGHEVASSRAARLLERAQRGLDGGAVAAARARPARRSICLPSSAGRSRAGSSGRSSPSV